MFDSDDESLGWHACASVMVDATLGPMASPLPPVLGPAPGEKNNSQNAWLLGPFRSPLSPGSTKHRYGNHAWDQPALWGPCMPETVGYRGLNPGPPAPKAEIIPPDLVGARDKLLPPTPQASAGSL
ncbi:hypothetical protein DFJ73DRAFT_761519 [Zopfochytrium polystomum]|nr:hypothetical protein DFJ73DRAFT_761519 [Zopfochytrium polystomum]